ncbi:MAG: DUF1802 family protein [Actinobacteria bacterium]|nr:DUF1802 family protein [Actinomycetota bacterium]
MPQASRTPAFKEWAVIVDALLEGEQIVDIRKGGIREEGRHFALQATRCWLYPTVEHQKPELLKAAYRHRVDGTSDPRDGQVRIDGWADIVGIAKITEPEHLEALDSKLIWSGDYASTRLRWKRRDPLWVLVMRAHRLLEPLRTPFRDEYAGCSSWVDLTGVPEDAASLASEPALSDTAFEARLQGVVAALPNGLTAPVGEAGPVSLEDPPTQ